MELWNFRVSVFYAILSVRIVYLSMVIVFIVTYVGTGIFCYRRKENVQWNVLKDIFQVFIQFVFLVFFFQIQMLWVLDFFVFFLKCFYCQKFQVFIYFFFNENLVDGFYFF